MIWKFISRVFCVVLLGWAAMLAAPIATAQMLAEADLVAALRQGGLVVVTRHGATHADQADTDPLNVATPGNETRQRRLNDAGRATARAWNDAIKRLGIPVGQVFSSQFERAYETARLAFGEPAITADLSEGGLVVTPNENNRRAAAFRKMAATAPKPGTNTFMVTHRPNVLDAFGRDLFDMREGESAIFRPADGKFQLVGRVLPEQWAAFAEKHSK
jgi:phosphohistidine phosphatase SixA